MCVCALVGRGGRVLAGGLLSLVVVVVGMRRCACVAVAGQPRMHKPRACTTCARTQVTHRLHTVRVELYNGYDDDVRYAFEIILSMWIFGMLLWMFWDIIKTQKEKKNFLKVCVPVCLCRMCVCVWWVGAVLSRDIIKTQ